MHSPSGLLDSTETAFRQLQIHTRGSRSLRPFTFSRSKHLLGSEVIWCDPNLNHRLACTTICDGLPGPQRKHSLRWELMPELEVDFEVDRSPLAEILYQEITNFHYHGKGNGQKEVRKKKKTETYLCLVDLRVTKTLLTRDCLWLPWTCKLGNP